MSLRVVRLPTLVAAALIALAALAGCGKPGGGGPGPGGRGDMVVNVVAFASRQQPVEERISLVGSLEAREAVELKSEIDGIVESIHFDEGQPVSQGTIMLEFDRGKLKATLAAAIAELQLAEARLQRYLRLVETGAVSRQEAEEASATYETRAAAVALAEEDLRDGLVRAPFDGVIGERMVSPGQFVGKGATLTWVVDLEPMKAEFQVPERYLRQVQLGQSVELRVAAYPDAQFTGTVTFVDPQVDETTRTVLVKAEVPNADGRLRRGMFANLDLIIRVREQAIVVPESALLLQGDATSVFVIDGGVAQPRPVTTGIRLPGLVEITDGLSPGQAVVVEGTQKLFPGVKVDARFVEEPPAPQPFGPPSPMGSGGG